MKRHLNTLFIMTQGAYLHKDHESIVVDVEGEERMRVPTHNIASIVCFGNVLCSPFLLGHCADNRVPVSFLTERGRFLARVYGPTSGNVLLRREQYRKADDALETCRIAKWMITGKIGNSRTQIRRFVRDYYPQGMEAADKAIKVLDRCLRVLPKVEDVDEARGYEGEAAHAYFSFFDNFILRDGDSFRFNGRNRRPPLDRTNAMLSFMYTIVLNDVRGALETVGLDPSVGYLHRDRPGRPGLALDMMEEFRPWIADRVVLNLINRKEVGENEFDFDESGAVYMNTESRKKLLTQYQERKKEELRHPFLDESMSLGIMFFAQALLFARFVRGDIDAYPPLLVR